MSETKAVRIHQYGGSEVLSYDDVRKPDAAPGEILVRVRAIGVNPLDWKLRACYLKDFLPLQFPATLGAELSGEIEQLGAGVSGFDIGDQIYANTGFPRFGAYAEYVSLPADSVAKKPRTVDFIAAAGLPVAGATAWQALFAPENINLAEGQTVLIHGAAGGVGSIAVQLAKWKGAKVAGTSSSANISFLKDIGVDIPIDYNSGRFEDQVKNIDAVFDLIGGEVSSRSWTVLKPGGVLASAVGEPETTAASAGKRGAAVYGNSDTA
jgi:NADPH:quinone reductase-like Zn-dependent oxidoreductase